MMMGNWTFHAYVMAPDGKSNIIHLHDGMEVIRGNQRIKLTGWEIPYNPRDLMWHPDCKQVAMWAPVTKEEPRRAIALMDVTRLSPSYRPEDPPPYKVIYRSTEQRSPFGFEWSPQGDALFVVESVYEPETSTYFGEIVRVDLSRPDKPRTIVRLPGHIDFFMPPVSRFERGEGPSPRPYFLIFGHREGLFYVDPEGKQARRVSEIPAVGLHNVEWNPREDKNEVTLFFRRPVVSSDGRTFAGVWVVDIGAFEKQGDAALRSLYDGRDIHTLWYSPRGTYITWASPNAVWFQPPSAKEDQIVRIDPPAPGLGEVKGATWSDDESRLALTIGNTVFVYVLATKDIYQVASFGETSSHFCAEPRWVGNDLFLSVFEDAGAQRKKPGTRQLRFGKPKPKPESGEAPDGQ